MHVSLRKWFSFEGNEPNCIRLLQFCVLLLFNCCLIKTSWCLIKSNYIYERNVCNVGGLISQLLEGMCTWDAMWAMNIIVAMRRTSKDTAKAEKFQIFKCGKWPKWQEYQIVHCTRQLKNICLIKCCILLYSTQCVTMRPKITTHVFRINWIF